MEKLGRKSSQDKIRQRQYRTQQVSIHRYGDVVSESAELEIGKGQAQQEQDSEGKSARTAATLALNIPIPALGIRGLELDSKRFLIPVDQVLRHSRYLFNLAKLIIYTQKKSFPKVLPMTMVVVIFGLCIVHFSTPGIQQVPGMPYNWLR